MLHLVSLVLPIFGLIGLGYLARASGYVAERTGEGLSDFVFTIAIPALVFRTLVSAQTQAAQPWSYWAAYFIGAFAVWMIGMALARRFFRLDHGGAVIAGFSAAQANTVLVGIPIILETFGEEGAVPLFMLIAIHLPIAMSFATLLMEGRGAHVFTALRKLTHNPVVLAILLGAAARMMGFAPPSFIKVFLDMLAQAAVPCALVAMGMALYRYGLSEGLALPSLLTVLKLIVHPLLVYLLARHVFSMPPVWSGVAVLFAACPCGVNAFLFAERYRTGVGIASSSIALSTVFAAPTIMFWIWLLGAAPK